MASEGTGAAEGTRAWSLWIPLLIGGLLQALFAALAAMLIGAEKRTLQSMPDTEATYLASRVETDLGSPLPALRRLAGSWELRAGVAVYPRDGEDEEALLKRVDEAMYSVKKAGKNGYAFAVRP